MTWMLRIPFRDRRDSLIDVACAARELPDREDRATTRALVIGAQLEDGLETAGQLLDRLEAAGPDERRQLLDAAREAAGLKSASDIDDAERFEMLQKEAHHRAAKRPVPSCAVCGVHPTNANGMPDSISVACGGGIVPSTSHKRNPATCSRLRRRLMGACGSSIQTSTPASSTRTRPAASRKSSAAATAKPRPRRSGRHESATRSRSPRTITCGH